MTLDTTVRYDQDRVQERGEHAVVLGGSMAGLLAARVLTDAYQEVTVIERDQLSEQATPRRGVPQGHHVHVLLEAGRATISDLFPGYGEDLMTAGALIINVGEELRHYEEGDFLAPPATRMEMYCASRPLIETVVRDRLAALPSITIQSESQFTEYLTNSSSTTIEGVKIKHNGDEEAIPANLVVDATGRTSRTPNWLAEHGYQTPPVDEVSINFEYSSIQLERDTGDRRMIFAPQSPPRTYGGAAFPIENDRWLVTVGGMHDTETPGEVDAFREFTAQFPIDAIERIVANHEVISEEVSQYPFPSNRRHRYEQLDRFPSGLVVIGDAIASFNPIYGQGMSVAALEALQLHHTLASSSAAAIGPRFFQRAADVVDIAWTMAAGADFGFEQTTGPKPRGADAFNRYLSRLAKRAHTDNTLSEEFYRVLGMETPPTTLLQPKTIWRTLKP